MSPGADETMTSDRPEDTGRTYGPEPVCVDWHQFVLAEDGDSSNPWGHVSNGLVTPGPAGGATIHTGIANGNVAVSIELRDQASPADTAVWDQWEEIAEVTVEAATGRLIVAALIADAPDLPPLSTRGAGTYRVRVHARGRDIAYDASLVEGIVEDYLIQVWPGPPGPEIAHKQTDDCGAGRRRSAARSAARRASKHPGSTATER